MFTLLAIAIAVIALFMARSASNRVAALERQLAARDMKTEQPSAPPPAPSEPEIPIYVPPTDDVSRPVVQQQPTVVPPSVDAPPPVVSVPPTPAASGFDWENLVGIRLFSWIGAIAFVLAAVFLFKEAIEHGWLRPSVRAAIGLAAGIGMIVGCELRAARSYTFTVNALHGAGIAILYATLFAMHATWKLVPSGVAFVGMLIVTAVAVYLSTRRNSVFIALLGLIGGFATPAMLSSGENRPVALFSYLLLLNGGMSWIAYRKRWPLLSALSIALTVFYQWSWVDRFMTAAQLPLAAVIFTLFAVVGAAVLFARSEGEDARPAFRLIGAAAAVVPLIFAFFTAVVPEYGAQYWLLFGFLLLMTAGLAAIAVLRGPVWLHHVGAVATLVTWLVWLTASYTHGSWPWSLVWLALFVALYLAVGLRVDNAAVYTAGLLFFVFVALATQEGARAVTLIGAMLALLAIVIVFGIVRARPMVAAIAIAFSSIATMVLSAGLRVELLTHLILFVALMAVAWVSRKHFLVALAVPFYAATLLTTALPTGDSQLLFAGLLWAPFILYALLLGTRVRQSIAPHLAASLASAVFFFAAHDAFETMRLADWHGVLAVGFALVHILLLWRLMHGEAQSTRMAMVAGTALAFLTAAIPLQFENEWLTVALALEAAALAWLFGRIPHRGLLVWSGLLAIAVLVRLVFNSEVFEYHPKAATPIFNWYLYTYVICAVAMFVAARVAPADETNLRRFYAAAGVVELFFLLNIEIADYYSAGDTLTFNFMSSPLAQELTYTIGWALFALATLIAGIAVGSRGARVAALGLLLVTILKCFLHDLARLGGLYRVASLFGLAVSLVAVGLMLQKFVMMKRQTTA